MSETTAREVRADRAIQALRAIVLWRRCINANPQAYMKGLENDPDGLAVALFNGPIWDEAEDAVAR